MIGKTMLSLGLLALVSGQTTTTTTTTTPEATQPNEQAKQLASERRWKMHNRWMNQIARMGKHACSHKTEEAYLMKRMIDVLHTAAKKRCNTCPQFKKRPAKKHRKKRARKAKKAKKHRKRKNRKARKPKVKRRPRLIGAPRKPKCPINGLGWQHFEGKGSDIKGGVRDPEGTCDRGLTWVKKFRNIKNYKCKRNDQFAKNTKTGKMTRLSRTFSVTVGHGKCQVTKTWKHKNGKILETFRKGKGGKVIRATCVNRGHNWNAFSNVEGGVKMARGKGSCKKGMAWANAMAASYKKRNRYWMPYKCTKKKSWKIDGNNIKVPVVTFQVSHGTKDCQWVKQWKHIGSVLETSFNRNGVQIGRRSRPRINVQIAFNEANDKCKVPMDSYNWSPWHGSKGINQFDGDCKQGDSTKIANSGYRCFKSHSRLVQHRGCTTTPLWWWTVENRESKDKNCISKIAYRHHWCHVLKDTYRWNDVVSGTGRKRFTRGWKIRSREQWRIKGCHVGAKKRKNAKYWLERKPSTLPECTSTAACLNKGHNWKWFEQVGGVKDYNGLGKCSVGMKKVREMKQKNYRCWKRNHGSTGAIEFNVEHGKGNCIWRKRYFHTHGRLEEGMIKNGKKSGKVIEVKPTGEKITYEKVVRKCVNGVCKTVNKGKLNAKAHNKKNGGRLLRAVRYRMRKHRRTRYRVRNANDNLCAIYMRHVFNMAKMPLRGKKYRQRKARKMAKKALKKLQEKKSSN